MDQQKPEKNMAKPRQKDPCRKTQIEFVLCEKQYGFNDGYCKCMYYIT